MKLTRLVLLIGLAAWSAGCATSRPVLEEAAFVGAAKANVWPRCRCGLPRSPGSVVVIDAGEGKDPVCQVALVCPALHVEYVEASAASVPAGLVADARRDGDRRRHELAEAEALAAAAAKELEEVKAELARRKAGKPRRLPALPKPPAEAVLLTRTGAGQR